MLDSNERTDNSKGDGQTNGLIRPDFNDLFEEFQALTELTNRTKFLSFFQQVEEETKMKLQPERIAEMRNADILILFMLTLAQFIEKNNVSVNFAGAASGYFDNNRPKGIEDNVWKEAIQPFFETRTFLGLEFIIVDNKIDAVKLRELTSNSRNFGFLTSAADLILLFPTGSHSGLLTSEQYVPLYEKLVRLGFHGANNWY